MRYKVLAAAFAFCLAAAAQSLTVDQLVKFVKSAKSLQQPDKQLADYLLKAKLTERLDSGALEELEVLGLGPNTVKALRVLHERSQSLPAAAVVEPEPAPVKAPPPSSEEQAAILDEVREYALNYSAGLPDFICAQETVRSASPLGKEPHWRKLDDLLIKLTYFQKKESYTPVLHNGALTNQSYDKIGGSKSYGDFGTMMLAVFEPSTQTHFEWAQWGTLRGQRVMEFAFRVSRDRSNYQLDVHDAGQSIVTAYRGIVAIDKATHKIVRLITIAEDIPPDFPIKSAQTTLDYKYVDISGHDFLLPSNVEVLMGGANGIDKLENTFRSYQKYSADAVINFGDIKK